MSSITAGTTSTTTLIHSGDTTGSLVFKTNDTGSGGTTAVTIDTSQRAAFVAGTAALPAITTSGDTNTGIFFPAADTIAFAEGGTEAMRIDSSGNVGIGTSSPSTKLQVNAASGYNGISVNNSSSTTATRIVMNNDTSQYLQLDVGSSGRSSYAASGPNVVSVTSGATGGFNLGTDNAYPLALYTNGSERMRIDSSGNLLVGKTAMGVSTQGFGVYSTGDIEANAGTNPAAYFNRTNDGTIMQFRRSGTTVGTISVTTSATAYNTSSDYRLKENIAPMTGALTKVAQLKPVTYKWKVDGSDGEGFIAHELAEVCPHAVSGEKDAVDAEGNPQYQGIDVSFLVATLTAAIQELKAINDQQAETINAQSEAIASLTARVVALESRGTV